MDGPVTPCRFRQFAERRLKLIAQYQDGVILDQDLGFTPNPSSGHVIFEGRVQCRKQVLVDVNEYLQIVRIPTHRSYKDGIVRLETYEYYVFHEDGINICRFDGPHLREATPQFSNPGSENHGHHEHEHVHLFDPSLSGGEKVHRTWPGETPTLIGILKTLHDWRHGVEAQIAGHTMRVWPFDEEEPTH